MSRKKGFKHSEKTKRKIREGNLGKKRIEETKEKIRQSKLKNPTRFWLGKKRSLEDKIKMRQGQKNRKRKPMSKETKKKISKSNKIALKNFYIKNPKYKNSGMWKKGFHYSQKTEWKKGVKNSVKFTKEVNERRIKKIIKGLCNRPTTYEKKISELCIENNLPFVYTGDGRFLINFKNPDFVNKKDKVVIEVFCSWFKIRGYGSVENYKIFCREKYNKFGWKVIFIDESEVDINNWKEVYLNKIKNEKRL